MNDPARVRGRQAVEVGKLIKLALFGTKDEIAEKAQEAASDVHTQVQEHKERKRMINAGCRVDGQGQGGEGRRQ